MSRARSSSRSRAGGAADTPLKRYRGKRDFRRTPEPKGAQAGPGEQLRFVIHEHHARRLHWDLRLERDGVLASWALPKGLPDAPRENRFAAHTEDHPLEYLDFEGEIPRGEYGAGKMSIWDRGTYECLKWEPRKVEVALHGSRLEGRYALFPIAQGEDAKDWMIHRMDPPADPGREPMPTRLVPMLARPGTLPDDDGRWAFEIKWDGVRAIAYSTPGELRLESRNLNDVSDRYPELAPLARELGSRSAILDGEIVAFGPDGRPSFEALQQRMQLGSRAQARRRAERAPVSYMIFDLLWLDGHSLMELPYAERRARLAELGLAGERWQTPEHVVGHGSELLEASVEQGLEGVVAKRLDSVYQPGIRSASWLKIKTFGRQEFVIGGWTAGRGRRSSGIGALLLGVHDPDGALVYVGRAGSGLSESEIARLSKLLAPLERETSPFARGPRPPRDARFCEPRLVAEVEFSEWTSSGSLRHPTYRGLRDDKKPDQVVREIPSPPAGEPPETEGPGAGLQIEERRGGPGDAEVGGHRLALSNLAKVLYPEAGFSKRQLIDYYAAVAPVLLGHLAGRALTVTRWPDGIEGKSFFQKQAPGHTPEWVRTVTLPSERKPIDYVEVEDLATLVWLANLAAIELHTPLARAEQVDRPTVLVFDLDPGAPAEVLACCRVALLLRGMFENLGLASFVKTSGSKGLQVYLPLNDPGVSFAQTKPFARAVAELLASEAPDMVVATMTKARRTGKVLIDWSQNDARKTTVCAYSLRATPRPTVSTPLAWEEVERALDREDGSLLSFEHDAVLARIADRGDLFAPVLSRVQQLPGL
jgi:bifunctional non-homologous end joining protein LigD